MNWLRKLFFSPKKAGNRGEDLSAEKLDWVKLFGYSGKMLRNVYLPTSDGKTTEIDILYVTRKGIFVLECKNYSGWIFGREDQPYWTQSLYRGRGWFGGKKLETHSFYNPVWQNKTHMSVLRQVVGEEVPLYSVIVFSDHCRLQKVRVRKRHAAVCQEKNLPRQIRKIWRRHRLHLTDEEVARVVRRIQDCRREGRDVERSHIKDVRTGGICPLCGGKLVLRNSPHGRFYGCSHYPRCRYTRSCEF